MSPVVVSLLFASAGSVRNIVKVEIVRIRRVIASFLWLAEIGAMGFCLSFWCFCFLLILNLNQRFFLGVVRKKMGFWSFYTDWAVKRNPNEKSPGVLTDS